MAHDGAMPPLTRYTLPAAQLFHVTGCFIFWSTAPLSALLQPMQAVPRTFTGERMVGFWLNVARSVESRFDLSISTNARVYTVREKHMNRIMRTRAALAVVTAVLTCTTILPAQATDSPIAQVLRRSDQRIAEGPYKAAWESLKAHRDPEWFRDAKFGIYTHWGPITVATENAPAEMEWYGQQLYLPKHAAFRYHQQTFGDQKLVGYKDVIPHFKAEKFDAEAWADLFARAGAKFAGPVAIHHDHFANWDSAVTRWNSKAMGPKRDLTGELETAIRKRGLKFLSTFHHGFAWRYYEPAYAYDAGDPQYADLYGEPHKANDPPSKRFLDTWLALVDEAVERYEPDLIWFDFELGSVIPPEYRQRMFALVYNWAKQNGREIGVAHKHREIHEFTGILDFERGREDRLTEYPWLTDSSVGPWFHHPCLSYRSLDQLVDVFVDIVSKNGCLLLNVGPQADGSIPEKAQQLLVGMGDWLKVNGEAIYGTRPWGIFGEGPTRTRGGGFSENGDRAYTAADIRFTTKGNTLYAIALAWPENGRLLVRSLARPEGQAAGKVAAVSLLGNQGELEWSQTAEGLAVALPARKPCENAFTLRITGQDIQAPAQTGNVVRPSGDGSMLLEPGNADLHGVKVRIEERDGHEYIAAWDDPREWVSWTIQFPAQGVYNVTLVYSAAYQETAFELELAGQKLGGKAAKTRSWFDYETLDLGKIEIIAAGQQKLGVRSRGAAKWKAMNVRSIRLTKAP